jgi:hypothetical protein
VENLAAIAAPRPRSKKYPEETQNPASRSPSGEDYLARNRAANPEPHKPREESGAVTQI